MHRILTLLAFLGGAALGCSKPSDDQAPDEAQAPAAPRGPVAQPEPAGLTNPSALELHLVVPDTVPLGEPIPMQLSVTNRGTQPARLRTAAPVPNFDLVVTRADGERVWSYRGEHALLQGAQILTLAPGESRYLTGGAQSVWNQREIVPVPRSVENRDPAAVRRRWPQVRPGTYPVFGTFRFTLGEGRAVHVLQTSPQPLVIVANRQR